MSVFSRHTYRDILPFHKRNDTEFKLTTESQRALDKGVEDWAGKLKRRIAWDGIQPRDDGLEHNGETSTCVKNGNAATNKSPTSTKEKNKAAFRTGNREAADLYGGGNDAPSHKAEAPSHDTQKETIPNGKNNDSRKPPVIADNSGSNVEEGISSNDTDAGEQGTFAMESSLTGHGCTAFTPGPSALQPPAQTRGKNYRKNNRTRDSRKRRKRE